MDADAPSPTDDHVGPSGAPQSSADVVTTVKKAIFIGADAKLSLAPGIPINLFAHAVSLRTTAAPVSITDDGIQELHDKPVESEVQSSIHASQPASGDPLSISRDDANISDADEYIRDSLLILKADFPYVHSPGLASDDATGGPVYDDYTPQRVPGVVESSSGNLSEQSTGPVFDTSAKKPHDTGGNKDSAALSAADGDDDGTPVWQDTPSQTVDGTEEVTQEHNVAAQVEEYNKHQKAKRDEFNEKVKKYYRKYPSKATESHGDAARPDVPLMLTSASPSKPKRDRVAIRKRKIAVVDQTPRRSPRLGKIGVSPSNPSPPAGKIGTPKRRRMVDEDYVPDSDADAGVLGGKKVSRKKRARVAADNTSKGGNAIGNKKKGRVSKKAKHSNDDDDADNAGARPFQQTVRCSLGEVHLAAKLLKEPHRKKVCEAGFGCVFDWVLEGNVSRPLMCVLLSRIDTTTMKLECGPGRTLHVNREAVHYIFGFPIGGVTVPRPSASGHDPGLAKLKEELGFDSKDSIETKDLRELLTELVQDETKVDSAVKVFFAILFTKLICPGNAARIGRQAAMLVNLDYKMMPKMDFCQLVVDELKRAAEKYQNTDISQGGVEGCGVVPVVQYLDSCHSLKHSVMDRRTPRANFLHEKQLRAIYLQDRITNGKSDLSKYKLGKLPWKGRNDIVYSYELPVEKLQISRGSDCGKGALESSSIPQLTQSAAQQDGVGMPACTSNAVRSSSVATIRSIDRLLLKVEDLSRSVPSIDALISTEDSNSSAVLKEAVGLDAGVLDNLQSAVSLLRKSFANYGTKQDLLFSLFDKQSGREQNIPGAGLGQRESDAEADAKLAEEFAMHNQEGELSDDEEDNEEEPPLRRERSPISPPLAFTDEEGSSDAEDADEVVRNDNFIPSSQLGEQKVAEGSEVEGNNSPSDVPNEELVSGFAADKRPSDVPHEEAEAVRGDVGGSGSCGNPDESHINVATGLGNAEPPQVESPAQQADAQAAPVADAQGPDIIAKQDVFVAVKDSSTDGPLRAVPAAVDDGAKSTAIVEPLAESFANAQAPYMVANQDASDLNKEATTDAPLESQEESLVFATAGDEDTPTDHSQGPVFDSPGDDIASAPLATPVSRLPAIRIIKDVYHAVIRLRKHPVKKNTVLFRNNDCEATIGEVAEAFKPNGMLCSVVVSVGTYLLGKKFKYTAKMVAPYICSRHIFEGNLTSKPVRKLFSLAAVERLDRKDIILFATFDPPPITGSVGHFCVVVLNLKLERFQLLDSLRGDNDPDAQRVFFTMASRIKKLWRQATNKNGDSFEPRSIDHFGMDYVRVPKQLTPHDCGFFMLHLLLTWDGVGYVIFVQDDILNIRMTTLYSWLTSGDFNIDMKGLFDVEAGPALSLEEDSYAMYETQVITPEVHIMGEVNLVNVVSKAKKAAFKLHSSGRKAITTRSLAHEDRGKGVPQVIIDDDDDDFVSVPALKNKAKPVMNDPKICPNGSSDDFVTQQDKKLPSRPSGSLVISNKRASKLSVKYREPVEKLVPYEFPFLSKAKEIKSLILSPEYLEKNGTVHLLKVTSPHGDELCVNGKDMFKAFGRGEMMDAELMELILSYWKDDPIRRTVFESGKRVLLGPYFIPYVLEFEPFSSQQEGCSFNLKQAVKMFKSYVRASENLLTSKLVLIPRFHSDHYTLYVLNRYSCTVDIFDSIKYSKGNYGTRTNHHKDRIEIMRRLVAVMKEVYGEEEYNKHNGVDWERKADSCCYYNTPEQGANECGFYTLKFAATYDGDKLVERLRHKDHRVEEWKAEHMYHLLFHPKNEISSDDWPAELADLVLLLGIASQSRED